MWRKASRAGAALLGVCLAFGCGRVRHDVGGVSADSPMGGNGTATASAGAAATAESAASGAGGASAGAAAVSALCELPLSGRCGEFEAAPPRVFRLRPDEYANSVRTLFGVDVDVAAALGQGPFELQVNTLDPSFILPVVPEYLAAAELAAKRIAADAGRILPCATDDCVATFMVEQAPRVWRGSVAEADEVALISVFTASPGDTSAKLQALLTQLLGSTRFYSRTELGDTSVMGPRALSADELAAKLSYRIWADTPDDTLLELARGGMLTRAADVRTQARRLLNDPRAAGGLAAFYTSWLRLADLATRDPATFPGWSAELGPAMQQETLAFLNSIIVDGDAKFETVFDADYSFVPPALAPLYGLPAAKIALPRVTLPPERRGLLTQASFLSRASYAGRISPTLRGARLREDLLCEYVPLQNEHPLPSQITYDESLPPRERAYWVTRAGCSPCHRALDELGFGFDNFDALGAYRTSDNFGVIDASGQLLTYTGDVTFAFNGVPELGAFMAHDAQAFACVAQQFLTWTSGRGDSCGAAQAVRPSCQAGDLRELLAAAAAADVFRFVNAEPGLDPVAKTEQKCDVGGLSDCETLSALAGVSLEECERCQGAACGSPGCSPSFPCRGTIVIRGCCDDAECSGLAPFCGKATAPHRLCVMDDAF